MSKSKSLYSRRDVMEMADIVSAKLNIPKHVVVTAYGLFYENIKTKIANADLENYSGSDSYESVLSFNIKHVGKFYASGHAITEINKQIKNREKNEDFEY